MECQIVTFKIILPYLVVTKSKILDLIYYNNCLKTTYKNIKIANKFNTDCQTVAKEENINTYKNYKLIATDVITTGATVFNIPIYKQLMLPSKYKNFAISEIKAFKELALSIYNLLPTKYRQAIRTLIITIVIETNTIPTTYNNKTKSAYISK